MKFEPALQRGILIQRYKRFLADIRLGTGEVVTIHCPNTGSMKNCILPESPCWFSTSGNIKRKYARTWELATTPDGHLAGINTARSNALVVEGIKTGAISELGSYENLRCEVPYGRERSRIDIVLQQGDKSCFVEVKNVTLGEAGGLGRFPDAVSTRGTRHLRELMSMLALGHRAVLVFCVQHTGIDWVEPADAIDPIYGETLREAVHRGMEVLVYRAAICPEEIVLRERIPFRC